MVFIIATKKSNGGKEIRRKKKVLEVAGKMFKKKTYQIQPRILLGLDFDENCPNPTQYLGGKVLKKTVEKTDNHMTMVS